MRSGRGAQTRNCVVPSPAGRAPSGRSKGRGGSNTGDPRDLERGRGAGRLELGHGGGHGVDLGRERLHGGGVALADRGQGGPALVEVLLQRREVALDLLVLGLHRAETLTRTPRRGTSGRAPCCPQTCGDLSCSCSPCSPPPSRPRRTPRPRPPSPPPVPRSRSPTPARR